MKNSLTIAFFVIVIGLLIVFYWWVNVSNAYSFFVAGHVYGDANLKSMHIHPPFKERFPYIQKTPGMAFGVLTGDVVKKAAPAYFDKFIAEMEELELPYYIAPGNHDVANRELFEHLFGDRQRGNRSFGGFIHENDLFLLLDGNLDDWSIAGEQLEFTRELLDRFGPKSRNIFVFVHQLIWWSPHNKFRNVVTNWPPLTPDTTNYWSQVEPMLSAVGKPVYLFAGDLGGNQIATAFMYCKEGNISYVAGGMGHGKEDNFVIVHVNSEGEVTLELVALQGNPHSLGKLEDDILP